MTKNLRRMKRTRTLAMSVGVALGMMLATLGPHLAQAATSWPPMPILKLERTDPPVDVPLDALSQPAA
jgi:hypothetical protein